MKKLSKMKLNQNGKLMKNNEMKMIVGGASARCYVQCEWNGPKYDVTGCDQVFQKCGRYDSPCSCS